MTKLWRVARDLEAECFIEKIHGELQSLFGISSAEARARIEQAWGNLAAGEIGGPEELAFHEEPSYWAHTIYYGKSSCWWLTATERERRGLPRLSPVPLTQMGNET